RYILRPGIGFLQRQAHGKGCPLSRRAFNGDRAAHGFHQPSRDGKAEPCAVLPAGSPLGGLLELLENALGRFGLEAGARVIHLEGERGAIALPGPCHGNEYRSEEHTSELQSRENLVCRLLLEKNKSTNRH